MDPACRLTSVSASSSGSTRPTLPGATAEPDLDSPSHAGSRTSTTVASSPRTDPTAARVFSLICLSYRALRTRADDGPMYDVAPDHAIGIYAGLIALAVAVLAVRRGGRHRKQPATVQIACVLMAVTAVVHLALIPEHLSTDPVTSVLFLFNGVAFLTLAVAVDWRWWRSSSAALLVATILGYLFYVALRLEGPDQV